MAHEKAAFIFLKAEYCRVPRRSAAMTKWIDFSPLNSGIFQIL